MKARMVKCLNCGYRALIWYDGDKCLKCKVGKLEIIAEEKKDAKKH